MNVSEKLGPWTTSTPSDSVPLGKPIQSAPDTLSQAHILSWSVASVPSAGTTELIVPKIASNNHESRKPNTSVSRTAIRAQNPGNSTAAHTMNVMVSSATHWSWGQ